MDRHPFSGKIRRKKKKIEDEKLAERYVCDCRRMNMKHFVIFLLLTLSIKFIKNFGNNVNFFPISNSEQHFFFSVVITAVKIG